MLTLFIVLFSTQGFSLYEQSKKLMDKAAENGDQVLWEMQKAAFKSIISTKISQFAQNHGYGNATYATNVVLYILDECFVVYDELPVDYQKDIRHFMVNVTSQWGTLKDDDKALVRHHFKEFLTQNITSQQGTIDSLSKNFREIIQQSNLSHAINNFSTHLNSTSTTAANPIVIVPQIMNTTEEKLSITDYLNITKGLEPRVETDLQNVLSNAEFEQQEIDQIKKSFMEKCIKQQFCEPPPAETIMPLMVMSAIAAIVIICTLAFFKRRGRLSRTSFVVIQ